MPPYEPGSAQDFFLLKEHFSFPIMLVGATPSGFVKRLETAFIVTDTVQVNISA